MKQKVLLTGASGFVGRHVLARLHAAGVPLRVIARPRRDRGADWPPGAEIIETGDLFAEPAAWWADVAAGCSRVLHLAWYVEPGLYLRSPRNLDCLAGTLAMARGCARAGVSRFVGVGTCFEYDTSAGHLSVDTPLRPMSPYAAAKAAAYLALDGFLREAGISFAWCRLFYLHGEGEDPRRLIAYVRQRLAQRLPVELTHANQVRDYMPVEDAARDLAQHLMGERQGAINVCSGRAVTVRALVEALADASGHRDLLRFGARPDNDIDPPVIVGVKD
ncbi:oxidoreductase [Bordetella sp. H567]|uniref:NAD-dependent epimerase/dehydratase family protein n=1 Tax=Bordetella sp. H567 TaxID=1697043 RepID=UPI00081D2214|nr:NAD(P)-dependent oxidoreductase [Bordetella sp. H567]AOB31014.1 oxidoreductase [Bordetella sp. H567]